MSTYNFTVHLDRVPDDDGYDRLYEAGLDDTGLETGADGRAWLTVAREAGDMAQAIVSVVTQIARAGYRAVGIETEDLVNLSVIARRTGRTRESVRLLAAGKRGPGGFPPPATTGHTPLYSWSAVRNWFAVTNTEALEPADADEDTLAAADLLLRARLLMPHLGGLKPLIDA